MMPTETKPKEGLNADENRRFYEFVGEVDTALAADGFGVLVGVGSEPYNYKLPDDVAGNETMQRHLTETYRDVGIKARITNKDGTSYLRLTREIQM